MKHFFLFTVLVSVLSLFSCQKDDPHSPVETHSHIPDYLPEKIAKLGVNPEAGIVPHSIKVGNIERKGWRVGDIFFSEEYLKEAEDLPLKADLKNPNVEKAFRRNVLVEVPITGQRVIKVIAFDLIEVFRTSLIRATNHYNRLGLKIRFEVIARRTPQRIDDADILVFDTGNEDLVSAFAEFPKNGNPGRTIEIDRGLQELPRGGVIRTLMHEIGHTIGLRHSDFRTIRSCVIYNDAITEFANELDSQRAVLFDFIHVPGTDASGDFLDSLMARCSHFEDISFRFFPEDIKTLGILY